MKRPLLTNKLQSWVTWVKARSEVLVPVLGLPLFFGMVSWAERDLTASQVVLVWGLAIAYAVLVLWSPMALPAKDPRPLTWAGLRRAAAIVVPVVLVAVLLQMALSSSSDRSGKSGLSVLLLMTALGIAGVAAERTLPVDLFPVLRRREIRRILYVIVAALFLAIVKQMWGGFFGDLAEGIGSALGETPPDMRETASLFDVGGPLRLFLYFLIGAGIFEELLFRVGIMTPVWALTRRWWLGLLVSALLFGLYHISPLSGIGAYNLRTAPMIAVVTSFGMGLANGFIYRYRGFTTAVMAHALGDWLVVMILIGMGT
jgi:membrane protease YdiL (CAAX protease family)